MVACPLRVKKKEMTLEQVRFDEGLKPQLRIKVRQGPFSQKPQTWVNLSLQADLRNQAIVCRIRSSIRKQYNFGLGV